ncbi:Hypothetical Protein SiL_0852 [Sulfolobus islandicus LAL14/1]|uniref:Uncharacterized protein n=2 Tax=Saccharolobus islandicus TaxID=43080 RepID=M9U854_SACIS|nr:Hypothetical Protein SiL_0852 [Sulfolobus islandicus LAL14/1]
MEGRQNYRSSIYSSQQILVTKNLDIKNSYLTIYKNRGGYASVSSMAMRKEILDYYATYLNQIHLAINSFYLTIGFLSKYDLLFDNIILGKYRLQKYSGSSNLTNFHDFIHSYNSKFKFQCIDMRTICSLTKGSEIEEFLRYDYLFLKVVYKLFNVSNLKRNIMTITAS